ncbi:MAG: hypothetical protein QMD82_05640 [bacterium]|nr:hypothetical protein [bacterium]
MLNVLILLSCLFSSPDVHSKYNFNKYQKHFIEEALKKPLDSLSEDEVMEFWNGPDAASARYTIGIYLAELMRRYFKGRGLNVPDTTWYDFWTALHELETNEDFKRDSVNKYILNFFERFLGHGYGRSGVMFTKRLENIRIERRLKARVDLPRLCKKGEYLISWEPRQVVAVHDPLIYHFGDGCNMEEIWRNMAVKDTGILLTFRPIHAGIVPDYIIEENGGLGGHLNEGKLLLISYVSGKAIPLLERWKMSILEVFWGGFGMQDLVSDDDSCIKAIREIAVLKEDGWHYVGLFPPDEGIKEYLERRRKTGEVLIDVDYDPMGESAYYVFPEVIFTDDVVQSVLKFIRKELPVLKQER